MTQQEAGGYPEARAALLRADPRRGVARRSALSDLSDQWLTSLLREARQAVEAGQPRVALVAVGGYGRRRLSPRSDLDVLLLHDGRDSAAVAELAERIWYPIWDAGVELDHSVRDLTTARHVARDDLKAQLGLLDARHIAGDDALTAELRSELLADWRSSAPRRLPELHELCLERAERHGELAFLLEPDLKEARGGLRDVTALSAVAASWVADAPREGLADAAARLADVRDALHLASGRATDRLSLQDQDQVAAELGVLDADILLREVYEAARTVAYASEVTWREVRKVLGARQNRGRRPSFLRRGGGGAVTAVQRVPLAEGVVEQDGEAVLAVAARPAQDPVLPLRAAAAAAQAGLTIAPGTVRRLSEAAAAHPLPVPWPEEARAQLVTLLGAGRSAVPVWEALEAGGLITRLMPDWERVRCRPQRNAVHRWTVDRHLVETAVQAAALTRRVDRPDLLLVAALLHDIGKGWPGDHSASGEVIARDLGRRFGFGKEDVDVLALLVRHHLLLVETATRRDPEDPATVAAITGTVGSVRTLELLHALTEADALATGPAAWSNWRAALVADLVRRASAVLSGEASGEASDAGEQTGPTADEERLAVEAVRTGGPVLSVREHHTAGDGGAGGDGGERGEGGADGEGGAESLGAELTLALPDRPGVLPLAAGVFALHRLTVLAASISELDPPAELGGAGDGRPVLVLSWTVAAEFGELPEPARLRADIRRALDGGLDVASRLAERDKARPRRRGVPAPPPRVTVARRASASATVLEVRAHDAPGLLHRIGLALEDAGVRVRTARISTLGADAVDAFYLTDADGRPLAPETESRLAKELERALSAG
ncbi:[protein-PII] uridylyltransferase [Phaeacidiphilus oryzae]|uniref:[protein-PII] uridylyltransferase n=1 Tax=Phaeacidiphilus oryzae TaxID=348818 RepID=UPI0005643DC9|nr:[protein-PII] uridylyltransferase [Phaeacidiphilus oryzae]